MAARKDLNRRVEAFRDDQVARARIVIADEADRETCVEAISRVLGSSAWTPRSTTTTPGSAPRGRRLSPSSGAERPAGGVLR
jgi:hypothetical protein